MVPVDLCCRQRAYKNGHQLLVSYSSTRNVRLRFPIAELGVSKVSSHEFADELIVAATADMLQLDLRVVPYTPPRAASQWVPWWSQHSSQDQLNHNRIVLGNADVHYVLLF